MLLSKAVQNAVVLIKECKKQEEGPVNLSSLADKFRLSRFFLEKISRKLRIAGILRSVKGPGGGYVLDKQGVTLLMVIDALMGPCDLVDIASIRVLHKHVRNNMSIEL